MPQLSLLGRIHVITVSSAAMFSVLPKPESIPAAQNLAGCHTEAVLQGGHAVLQNHVAALETRLGEKLHLGRTDEFLIFLTDDASETASATYLKLGCGLKITLEGEKSFFISLNDSRKPSCSYCCILPNKTKTKHQHIF